ncbi:uncharacterized protein swt1 [Eucyclogobius newberryi]|uniref:uncharacterized protein swt1 n=1 Tax=Eucyclogobius newberryi TaxID=166745 RepID=UPI003B5C0DF6
MAKKAKKRKRRKLSSSSSEDYGETSTSKRETSKRETSKRETSKRETSKRETSKRETSKRETSKRETSKRETSKTKRAQSPSKKKNDATVHKTKEDYRSSKDEARSWHHVKKPVSRLEKTKSARAESPIFKEEQSEHGKRPERKSSRDRSIKTYSQDELKAEKNVLIPRSVSVAQKEITRKRRWDVLPSETTEAKTPRLILNDTSTKYKPAKPNEHYHGQEDLKATLKSKTPAVAALEETKTDLKTTAKAWPSQQRKTPKESAVAWLSQQRKTLKERAVTTPQPLSKKTVVAEKSAEDKELTQSGSSATKRLNQSLNKQDSEPAFCSSFSPLCRADSPQTLDVPPYSKTPAVDVKIAAKDKNESVKSSQKASPAQHADQSLWTTPATAISKETTTATTSKIIFKLSPAQPRKTLKENDILPRLPPFGRLNFKIPKKTVIKALVKDNAVLQIQSDQTPSAHEPAPSVTKQPPQSSCSATIAPNQDPVNSFCPHTDPSPWQDQRNLAEELHQARSEKLLEVDVMQSYGELTCMEIDPPEEGAINTERKQQDLLIMLDTNILLSHLDYVKRIVTRGLKAESRSVVVIPWVVLQELDSLKKGRGLSGSVAHLAIPAISYIWNSLKGKESQLWGQSMQQAAESSNGLNAENNDDRVLQCCLQFQLLYPECAVILCTNDKNLCIKALLSGVKAFSKNDLETEVARCSLDSPFLQNVGTSTAPAGARHSVSTLAPGDVHAQTQAGYGQEATSLSVENENNETSEASDARRRRGHLDSLVCAFESCLQEALSDVLEAEMKAAYDDLWLEIVCRKPPWSLYDALHCMKKHWIAVFGHVVLRSKQQNVLNLLEFFTAGKALDENATLAALLDAKDLLETFVKRSSRVPSAISVVGNILNALQSHQGETSADDVVMREAEEDRLLASLQVPPCDVWALFENIWDHVFQASLSVFKALDFDPNASESAPPAGGLPPPQDVLLCLDRLARTVPQLLQAFSGVLTSPGSAEAQGLLSLMQSIQIVGADKLTATDLLNCFSQQEYRERLNVGGNQLLEVKAALDRCVAFAGRHVSCTAPP